jgi:ankyrin repeat protein
MIQRLTICFCLAAALNSLSLRADLDSAEELRQLIRTANYSQLEYRLKAGLDPQSRLPDGSLPLAWAAEMQDAQSMGLLLTHGALMMLTQGPTPSDRSSLPANTVKNRFLICCLMPMSMLR